MWLLLTHTISSLDPCNVTCHTHTSFPVFSLIIFQFVAFRTPRMNYRPRLTLSLCWLIPGRAFYKLKKSCFSTKVYNSCSPGSNPPLQPDLTPFRTPLTTHICGNDHAVPYPSASIFGLSSVCHKLPPGHRMDGSLLSFNSTFPSSKEKNNSSNHFLSQFLSNPPQLLHPLSRFWCLTEFHKLNNLLFIYLP